MNNLFKGIFDTSAVSTISLDKFLLCVGIALVCGIVLALCYAHRTRYTRSFLATLAMLPAVVCVVIMMVNGNVGAGVAVAGAFSLVRFRSVPGTAKEITMLFLAMGAGLLAGMGYLGYGMLFTIIMAVVSLIWAHLDLGTKKNAALYKTMNITIPEDLDYSQVFDGILEQYTTNFELSRVKTTNMGSLFRLTYDLTMKKGADEKKMVDELRCRNGNLEISVSKQDSMVTEL